MSTGSGPPEYQFWMTWTVQAIGVAGTVAAVVVALFGNWLKLKVTPPQLRLTLDSAAGVKVPVVLGNPETGAQRTEMGRWYHLRVENVRRWSPATNVQVFLQRVETPSPGGTDHLIWQGEIPIAWQHQAHNPIQRSIGPPARADLFSVVKGKWLELHPLIRPNELQTMYREACNLVVTLQARGVEGDSNPVRVRIAWDGGWSDDTAEMQRHLSIIPL